MEQQKTLDYDSDVIICEDIPATISVSTSLEKLKKPKKKRKRRVKRGINYNNNMETLLITQRLRVKKTKFKCVININTMCERSDSIERNRNVCKKDAYYHRIVPVCLRKMCSGAVSCCRSTESGDYNKHYHRKAESLSPVSSITLSEVFPCNNISYEEISNGSFSCASEEELDTLIKRTRQREKQIDNLHARKFLTSTPISKDGIASPFSIDTDKKSIHTDSTMIIDPLTTEAYSPTSLDVYKMDPLEIDDTTNALIGFNAPYSPTMTPDLIKMENLDYSPIDETHDDTHEIMDRDLENSTKFDMNQAYSPIFTPDIIEMDLDNAKEYIDEPYSPTLTPDTMNSNALDKDNAYQIIDVGYSYSPKSRIIKQEIFDEPTIKGNTVSQKAAILTPHWMKAKEDPSHVYDGTGYNMNNKMHCKSEIDGHKRGVQAKANTSKIIVKIEKDWTNINCVHSTASKNENIKEVKTEKV